MASERWRVFTSNHVVAESHALALRLGRDHAMRVLESFDRASAIGDLTIVRVTLRDEQRAREIIYRYDDKDFSLTDALSFSVMERLGIATAFSFDRDFEQYGLTMLSP